MSNSDKSATEASSAKTIWTHCANDGSDRSILSDWMDHSFGAEKEHNLEHDLTEFAQIPFRCANDYEICAKQSEYAFDISNY
ncbi:SAM-dependent methyltransferase [Caenorhabditis elegans]|uniref:SAM-dependent methyltransferase n=1 Tax=Caenorhabditis elegans TaxID=6239 RepID=O62172_CAEEL|nr:SAM-dependent methyltransferase [Caenorhabditis elegans]CAB02953.2 SAM-dependent methyltransferase [Caenorhabditis elegans]|eukprot:NP_001122455.1 Uncharacterized protein CELE_F15D3.9 [Caenorhabditis elegans]